MSTQGLECVLRLHRLQVRLRLAADEALGARYGIDLDDFTLLHALAVDGAASLASLASSLGSGRSGILKRTRPLEKIGLIACQGELSQRRVSIAPAGRRLVKTAEEVIEDVWASTTRHLSAADVDALSTALDHG